MRRFYFSFLAAIALALALAAPAMAQCTGVPNANTVCAGPTSGGAGFPGFRAVVAADIPSLPLSSLAAQANLTILANITGSSNPPAADTLTAILDAILGTTRGSLIERGASTWGVITPGTSGLPFVSNGAAADPAYQQVTAAGIANQTITATQIANATITATQIAATTITNGNLAAMTQNAVKGAASSTAVTDLAVPSCSTVNSGIQWTTNTGFGCRTTLADLATADQTLSGGANVTQLGLTTGNVTIDCGSRPLQSITNGGAFTITAPANDGSCMVLVTNNASAGTITFSGFSVGASTGDPLTTTNTSKFTLSIWRINGTSGYRVAAHQ
jgi:hypothetical protein